MSTPSPEEIAKAITSNFSRATGREMNPFAAEEIARIISEHGRPMTDEEIVEYGAEDLRNVYVRATPTQRAAFD